MKCFNIVCLFYLFLSNKAATWPWWSYLLIALGIFIILIIINYFVKVLQVQIARGGNDGQLPITVATATEENHIENQIAPKKRLSLVLLDLGRRHTGGRNSLIPGISFQKLRNSKSDDRDAIVIKSLLGNIYKQETRTNKYVSSNVTPKYDKKSIKSTETQRQSSNETISCCDTSKAFFHREASLISLKKIDSLISRTGSYMIKSILSPNINRENKIERHTFKHNSNVSLKDVCFMNDKSEFSGINTSLSKIYDIKIGSDHIQVIALSDVKDKSSFAKSAYENLCCKIYGDPLFFSHIKGKLLNNLFTIKGLKEAIDWPDIKDNIEENRASTSKEEEMQKSDPVKSTSGCEKVYFADGFLPGIGNTNWKRGIAIKLPSGIVLNTLDKEPQIEWTLNASKSERIQKINSVSTPFQNVRRYSL